MFYMSFNVIIHIPSNTGHVKNGGNTIAFECCMDLIDLNVHTLY